MDQKGFRGFVVKYRREIFAVTLAVVLVVIAVPIGTYAYFAQDLTSKERIMNRNNTGITLLDRQNQPFFTFYQAKIKTYVPLSKISLPAQQAVIAIEDKEFYQHPGFSLRGIARAIYLNLKSGDTVAGGSTITQQLVKNALLNPEKDFMRKFQEIILAQEIERRFSKNEILEMYLNSVYFGEGAFGIEEAAQTYFGISAEDLTISQSSLLAAILPSPSRMSPLSGDMDLATKRQKIVLQKMVEQGYITNELRNIAENTKLVFTQDKETLNRNAPHFAIYIKDILEKKYGEDFVSRSGLVVKTTIDLAFQQYAESVVTNQVANLAKNKVTNGAAVVLDPKTGEIHAMVGSKDWYDERFGRVNITLSPRSPGSAMKPIIYAAAFEKRIITPATLLRDEPTTFPGGYKPQNYDRKFRGPVLARRALANSLNVPSVSVMQKVGIEAGREMARRLGITTLPHDLSEYGLSFILGTKEISLLEMTGAYGVFANNGVKNAPVGILEITNKDGETIYSYTPSPKRVLASEVAFLISSILSDNKARREVFGNALTISRPAAVKTGTAEDYKDALTIGYTPSIVVGVWVGNNDNEPMDQIAGSLGAAPIWRALMEEFLAGRPVERFTPPPGVRAQLLCEGNSVAIKETSVSAGVTEYFLSGTGPKDICVTVTPTPSMSIAPTNTVTPTRRRSTPRLRRLTPTLTISPTTTPTPTLEIEILDEE